MENNQDLVFRWFAFKLNTVRQKDDAPAIAEEMRKAYHEGKKDKSVFHGMIEYR